MTPLPLKHVTHPVSWFSKKKSQLLNVLSWVVASSTPVREKAASSSQQLDLHHCQGFDYCLQAKCLFTTLWEYCSCHTACVFIYWIHYHKEMCQIVSGKRSRVAVTLTAFLWYSPPWFLRQQSRKFTLNRKQRRFWKAS